MKMKKKIRETAEEILQEYTSCYSEVDEDCLVNMLNRLASDVAREIFAEIEKKVKMSIITHLEELNKEHIIDTPLYDRHSGIIFALRSVEDYLAELKKKYESEKDNGNDTK